MGKQVGHTCPGGHGLSVSGASYEGVVGWACDRCRRPGHGGRWSCRDCCFDVCFSCAPRVSVAPPVPSVAAAAAAAAPPPAAAYPVQPLGWAQPPPHAQYAAAYAGVATPPSRLVPSAAAAAAQHQHAPPSLPPLVSQHPLPAAAVEQQPPPSLPPPLQWQQEEGGGGTPARQREHAACCDAQAQVAALTLRVRQLEDQNAVLIKQQGLAAEQAKELLDIVNLAQRYNLLEDRISAAVEDQAAAPINWDMPARR
eukprot:Rhum_TRINITY_DN12866_c0_g1::Rhum_TRINITY_DN12866_c0_g1_i1::g.54982::m.54982